MKVVVVNSRGQVTGEGTMNADGSISLCTGVTITRSAIHETEPIQLDAQCLVEWMEPKDEDDEFEAEARFESRAHSWSPIRPLAALRSISRQLVWMVRQLMHGQK